MSVRPAVALDLGQAEVGDPEVALGVEQQVGRLDVAVEDAAGRGRGPAPRPPAGPGRADGADVGPVAGRGGRGAAAGRWRPGVGPASRRRGRPTSGLASARASVGPSGRPRPGCAGAPVVPRAGWPTRPEASVAVEIAGGGPARGRRPGPGRRAAAARAITCGQAAALDELHGVEGHAPLAADRVDRHDVRVVQAGGGLGLELEPLQLPGVERRGERQDLQRHPAAQRELLGLVDDAHAAPADLAEDPEVAQEPSPRPGRPSGLGPGRGPVR